MQVVRTIRSDIRLNALVVEIRLAVDGHKSTAADQPGAPEHTRARSIQPHSFRRFADTGFRKGQGKGKDNADAWGLRWAFLRTRRPDRFLHRPRTHLDFEIIYGRARHRHHEGGRIAEIALKLDARCAVWQLRTERLKPQIDIAELLPGIRDIFGELDVDDGDARQRNRPNAVFVGGRRVDVLIFGDRLLDGPCDELLYFLGGRAG